MKPKAILLDADGVIWRGGAAVPGAPEFIARAKAAGLRTFLISNNAGPNRAAYVAKCEKLGLPLEADDIYSTNYLSGRYLAQNHPGQRVLVLGSELLLSEVRKHIDAIGATEWLTEAGVDTASPDPSDLQVIQTARFDVLLIGIDVRISYPKLCLACVAVQHGASLIGANPDFSFPVEGDILLPGNGSVVNLVAQVCSVEPTFLGKPTTNMLELIEAETGISRNEMVMIGDRVETDIVFAESAGIPAFLVLTGVTSREMLGEDFTAATVVDDLLRVAQLLAIP